MPIRFFQTGLLSPPAVRLDGPHVYVRPGSAKDWESWAALRDLSREFLTPWEPTWPADGLSRAAFTRRLRRQAAEWREDQGYSFLTFEQTTDRLVGGISLTNVRRGVAQMATMGYWVGHPFARRGYTTESVRLVLGFAFGQLGLHRVEAACLPTNIPSQGVLLKAGFVREGYARAYLRIDGKWADHILFAMLKDDIIR
ncbi:MAG: putative ribosomal-protein-alanine acetyltransferase [Pseudomonadota bacterium]